MKRDKSQIDKSDHVERAQCHNNPSSSSLAGHEKNDDIMLPQTSVQGMDEVPKGKCRTIVTRPRPGDRKRRASEMSSPFTTAAIPAENVDIGSHPHHSHLTFLGLSKSWVAAAKRAKTHPHEAQYGCTSSARMPLPLKHHNKSTMASSPLAIACRYGAPPETVKAILEADKNMVRRCIPNRGTPLHEAIMVYPKCANGSIPKSSPRSEQFYENDLHYVEIIRMLLDADEALECRGEIYDQSTDRMNNFQHDTSCVYEKRCTLIQDVDGNTPLHLLVRQAFYNYLGGMQERENIQNASEICETVMQQQHPLLTIIDDLIQSSPEASSMPDYTEFEETPLILVLKSSIYATEQHNLMQQQSHDRSDGESAADLNYNAQLERRIFDVCKIMLQSHPFAASSVASKSGYTAVHSAVFHGRCCDTIRLLLNADSTYRERVKENSVFEMREKFGLDQQQCKLYATESIESPCRSLPIPAALRANRFGECPLHFATMRGECTRTIEMLSHAAPWATLKRDVKFALTPLHWLFVRFVDTMFEQFGDRCSNGFDGNITENAASVFHADVLRSLDVDSEFDSNTSIKSTSTREFPISNRTAGEDQVKFDLEYHRRTVAIDPPVDYMRMRHILPEHTKVENTLTNRVIHVLCRVRERHRRLMANMLNRQTEQEDMKLEAKKIHCPRHKCGAAFKSSTFNPSSTDDNNELSMQVLERSRRSSSCETESSSNHHENVSATQRGGKGKGEDSGTQHNASPVSDLNKCPFRCPFVFDSYPIHSTQIGSDEAIVREEQVISLFWAKVISLLHAAAVAQSLRLGCKNVLFDASSIDVTKTYSTGLMLLHAAARSPSPFAIVRLCLALHPEQLMIPDSSGKLPLHHAAGRLICLREFETDNGQGNRRRSSFQDEGVNSRNGVDSNNSQNDVSRNAEVLVPDVRDIHQSNTSNFIEGESIRALQLILSSSPPKVSTTLDAANRLPFHYAIDSTVSALVHFQCSESEKSGCPGTGPFGIDKSISSVINLYRSMIHVAPDIVHAKDGLTGLYPFMQIAAVATEATARYSHDTEKGNRWILSLVYVVLLENPTVIAMDKLPTNI